MKPTNAQIREMVQNKATSEIADADKPLDDFGIDSLDMLDVNLELEELMGVTLPEMDIESGTYPTLNQYTAHVQSYG
jgi:acyl carrier protein